MKRHRLNKRSSKRYFTAAGSKIHRKNLMQGAMTAMRGGIRL